jgi:hypothetical protein
VDAALHSAETPRIAALRSYDILDTPREEEFDDIVRVVSDEEPSHRQRFQLVEVPR